MMKLKLDYHLIIMIRENHYPILWQKCICIQKRVTFACNPINEYRYASLQKLSQLYKFNNLWQLFNLCQLLQHDS